MVYVSAFLKNLNRDVLLIYRLDSVCMTIRLETKIKKTDRRSRCAPAQFVLSVGIVWIQEKNLGIKFKGLVYEKKGLIRSFTVRTQVRSFDLVGSQN